MRIRRSVVAAMFSVLIAIPLTAQVAGGQRGPAPAAAGPAMTMTISGVS